MTYSELPAQVIHQKCPLKGISEAGNSEGNQERLIPYIKISFEQLEVLGPVRSQTSSWAGLNPGGTPGLTSALDHGLS